MSGAVFRLSRRLRRLLRPCCTYGRSTWGHSVVELLDYLRGLVDVPGELYTYARELDRHYIPSRYLNAFESGYPGMYYDRAVAGRAISSAEALINWVRERLRSLGLDV